MFFYHRVPTSRSLYLLISDIHSIEVRLSHLAKDIEAIEFEAKAMKARTGILQSQADALARGGSGLESATPDWLKGEGSAE